MREINQHDAKVAMSLARHPDTGTVLKARDIPALRDQWPRTLRCHTTGCPARVHPVAARRTEKTAGKSPHFARNPSTVERPNDHSVDCLYNVAQAIAVLTDESGGELERGTSVDDGQMLQLFRLPFPETFVRPPSPDDTVPEPGGAVFAERATKLLNTAAKVAELLDKYEQAGAQPAIEFRAVCRGTDVNWLNFLYTWQRAWVLAQRLRNVGPLTHPAVVIFRPIKVGHSRRPDIGRGWAMAQIPTPVDHRYADDKLFVSGTRELVDAAFDTASNRAAASRLYIGYGMWHLTTFDAQPARLSLALVDDSVVTPLPNNIDTSVLRRWMRYRPTAG